MYKAIKAYGHDVWIVASSSNQSGKGGTTVYTTERNLTADTEFGIVKAGQPSVGPDPIDSHIWYYNGTPSAAVQIGLDYVLPRYANFTTPDLVMAGPNYGTNLGGYVYTLSGTMGATYLAINRGIPAISFSGAYSVQTPYYEVNTTTTAGLKDPATITGELCADLVQSMIIGTNGSKLLPTAYGLNVNIPYITSFKNDSCVNPPFIHTRLTGGADTDIAVYDETTGLFDWGNIVSAGANTCINGDCSLPGETVVLSSGCQSSVSVFTVDYDAPSCSGSQGVRTSLGPIVQYQNATTLVGGLNITGNGTASATGSAVTASASSYPISVASGLNHNLALGFIGLFMAILF